MKCVFILVLVTGLLTVGWGELPFDIDKCSLNYFRALMYEACSRPEPSRPPRESGNETVQSETFFGNASDNNVAGAILRSIPQDKLAPNSVLNYTRKESARVKRQAASHTDDKFDYVFHYCCYHIQECENLPCP